MEVGQGPNWGCSAKGKKNLHVVHITASETHTQKKEMGLKTGRLKHEKRTNGEVVLNPLQPI
jgi:hypothetical protein